MGDFPRPNQRHILNFSKQVRALHSTMSQGLILKKEKWLRKTLDLCSWDNHNQAKYLKLGHSIQRTGSVTYLSIAITTRLTYFYPRTCTLKNKMKELTLAKSNLKSAKSCQIGQTLPTELKVLQSCKLIVMEIILTGSGYCPLHRRWWKPKQVSIFLRKNRLVCLAQKLTRTWLCSVTPTT
jgi:hypothetical protein